jgi:hypothetical protein
LVSAGTPIGEIDVGYGPARSFSSAEVVTIHSFLDELSESDMRIRLAALPGAADELYYQVSWDDASGFDEELKALLDEVHNLKKFIVETMLQKRGLVVWLD